MGRPRPALLLSLLLLATDSVIIGGLAKAKSTDGLEPNVSDPPAGTPAKEAAQQRHVCGKPRDWSAETERHASAHPSRVLTGNKLATLSASAPALTLSVHVHVRARVQSTPNVIVSLLTKQFLTFWCACLGYLSGSIWAMLELLFMTTSSWSVHTAGYPARYEAKSAP
jgi:hypothetical protein